MPRFRAIDGIKGDYGRIQPGETFDVDEFQAKRLEKLERRGIIERVWDTAALPAAVCAPLESLKALVGYENKMIVSPQNKRQMRPS